MYLTRGNISLEPSESPSSCHPEPCLPTGRRSEGSDFRTGAEVIFLGKVRDHSQGKKVLFLEYEAYEPMAEKMIENLAAEAAKRWQIEDVRILHRLGRVGLGEIAVFIEVQSAHRDEAYQASRFLIESIKHQVPIWKKEYFADGTSEWGLCRHDTEISR